MPSKGFCPAKSTNKKLKKNGRDHANGGNHRWRDRIF